MQAIIFAAGRGTRMGTLTETCPKSMLPIFEKPILEYKLEALPESIDEVVLVVGYLGSVIHDHFGGEYNGKRILYVEQETPLGTADALWKAKDVLTGKFVAMNGDDLYATADIEALIAKEWAMLVEKREGAFSGGKAKVNAHGEIVEILEGKHTDPGLVNAGVYVCDTRLFEFEPVPKGDGETEVGLPQTILAAAHKLHVPVHAVHATHWIQITAPTDLKKAEQILSHKA